MKTVHLEGTPDAWTFARFDTACADLGVTPTHVLHVGGHLGQEVSHYRAAGVQRITYMEPTPECAAALRTVGDDVRVFEAAAAAEPGRTWLSICGGDGAWNTIRSERLIATGAYGGMHEPERVIDVAAMPIRDVQGDADVLVVDTQGTEVEALSSADLSDASPLQLVIVETQSSGHPEAAHREDVDRHMAAHGWAPVLAWNHEHDDKPHATFADVFYVPDWVRLP